jgi:FkbM family methyltransferase
MKTQIPQWMLGEVTEYDLDITPPPATILDIGANIGAFALHYSAKWPAACIWCFEPVPSNLSQLRENVAGLPQINIIATAVRNFSGPAEIWMGDHGATCSFHQRGRQTRCGEIVPCIDAGKIGSAELVKIDTEGCEVEILHRLDLSRTRAVVVEYHSTADRAEITRLLIARGFVCLHHRPGSQDHGVLKFSNDPGVTRCLTKPADKKRLYVAIAGHYAQNDVVFVQSLLRTVLDPGVQMEFGWFCDPSVARARNILTANFLSSACTHLLFIDTDIGFGPEDVSRIASHQESLVGGMYPLKTPSPEVQWCNNGLEGDSPVRADGLREVRYIGTGFMCIRRDVFEKMISADGASIHYRQDYPPHREEYAFWREGPHGGRYLTEDWLFCQRWLELGGQVFADTRVVLRHAGRAEWPLPIQSGNPFVKA